MESIEFKQSKKGRKPKNKIIPILKTSTQNMDIPIIAHLPINHSEIICNKQLNDIFIKSESNDIKIVEYSNDKEIKILKNKIDELTEKLKKYEKKSKTCVHILSNNKSKCWWCAHDYDTPTIELPEHYYNGTFYNNGNFCSYNCAMAYNIDINDENISKRNSLLNLQYIKTYNTYLPITPAPSWKILKDFGGSIDIEEFRNNFIINQVNYLYLKPPIISRISYVEKIPINEDVGINKTTDYVLKRSKPLNSTKYSLESAMGLKKILNINESI